MIYGGCSVWYCIKSVVRDFFSGIQNGTIYFALINLYDVSETPVQKADQSTKNMERHFLFEHDEEMKRKNLLKNVGISTSR